MHMFNLLQFVYVYVFYFYCAISFQFLLQFFNSISYFNVFIVSLYTAGTVFCLSLYGINLS